MNRPYSQYRHSGVDWLGEIPAHWDVLHLGFALSEAVGGGTPATSNEEYWADVDEEGLPWVAIADMSGGGTVVATQKRVTHAGLAAKRLKPLSAGTIIYSMYASVGAVARLGIRAVTNQAILGLLPGESLTRDFLYWWLTGIRKRVLAFTRNNTQSNLNAETVSKLPLVLPPLDDQRSITASLSWETNKVDALIAKKRMLIERLEEYRTALISRTVTRGLPPDASLAIGLSLSPQLKNSGVDRLGDVPVHWEVQSLRQVCQFSYGDSLPSEVRHPGEIPVFGSNGVIGSHNEANTESPVIVIGRKGSYGKVNYHEDQAFAIDTTYFVDKRFTGAHLRWLYYALLCADLTDVSMDSAVPGLSRSHAYRKTLAVPPLEEQQAIADFLDRQTKRIDTLSTRVEVAIERLLEYRTALISAAVTGKIDVRDSVAVGVGGVVG